MVNSPSRIPSQTLSPPPSASTGSTEADQFRAPAPRAANGQLTVDVNVRAPQAQATRPLRFPQEMMPPERSFSGSEDTRSIDRRSDFNRDVAPPLSSNSPQLSSPMSPPPTKSARRPAQTSAAVAASRTLQERAGMSPSASPGPQSQAPILPTKSGARVADSPRSERAEVPWKSPIKDRTEYFPAEEAVEAVDADDRKLSEGEAGGDEFGEVAIFDELLMNFRWAPDKGAKALSYMLQDEINAIEATSIHAIVENDDKIADLMAKLDRGIAQCDDMANLLTIYDFELASCEPDIRHIESQNKGLQVQTANQKALITEINKVLTDITISDYDLEVLKGRGGNLDSPDDIHRVEKALVNLYRALKLMDESVEDQSMSAIKGKRKDYEAHSSAFLSRMGQFLQGKYQAALTSGKQQNNTSSPARILPGHEDGLVSLFSYSSIVMYAQQIAPKAHADYMRKYAAASKSAWRDSILSFATQWRNLAKKATLDETEMMFTAAKDSQSAVSMRSATIKRTNTLAKQIRSVGKPDKSLDGQLPASEVFRVILDNVALIIANEQNFLVNLFHLSSRNAIDLPDYVASRPTLTVKMLDEHRQTEPNRNLAKERYMLMESIFGWISSDLVNLIDHLAKLDATQIVGILKATQVVIAEWNDSDQEFMLKTLRKLNDKATAMFSKFVNEQVKAITDIKVTSKKRGGILPVFEIFPDMFERMEYQLQDEDGASVQIAQLDVRTIVNDSYDQISKAMFDSVRTLAAAGSITAQSSTDPEDKEALNYHILMVENMHQYIEALNSRNDNPVLDDFRRGAAASYKEHLTAYARQAIMRPIGRLSDFADGLEKLRRAGENPTTKSTYSPTSVKRLLSDFDDRDIRKGIATMYKRVDKHFGSSAGGNEELLGQVWKSVQVEYVHLTDRVTALVSSTYQLTPEFTKQSIAAAFESK